MYAKERKKKKKEKISGAFNQMRSEESEDERERERKENKRKIGKSCLTSRYVVWHSFRFAYGLTSAVHLCFVYVEHRFPSFLPSFSFSLLFSRRVFESRARPIHKHKLLSIVGSALGVIGVEIGGYKVFSSFLFFVAQNIPTSFGSWAGRWRFWVFAFIPLPAGCPPTASNLARQS